MLRDGEPLLCPVSGIQVDMNAVRRRLFELIYECRNLAWLVLTKRPQLAYEWIGGKSGAGLEEFRHNFPHVALGTTVESPTVADERLRWLRRIPAVCRFVSAEPLLGPLGAFYCPDCGAHYGVDGHCLCADKGGVHWWIAGGESGPYAAAGPSRLVPAHPRRVPGRGPALLLQTVGGMGAAVAGLFPGGKVPLGNA